MNTERINVTKSYLPPRKTFEQYIDEIYSSHWLSNNGKLVQELENQLKQYLGVRNVVLTANGTLALQVTYKALGLSGEVITTPFSFVATASSLVWQNLIPIFADIETKGLTINPEEIEHAITNKTSGVVPVNIYGNTCDLDAIKEISETHDLKLVYDASHSFGVNYLGQSVFRKMDTSTLSFHATKLFHTIEGGAVVTNDDELADRVRSIVNFGIENGEEIGTLGINAKMNEFEAAMGLANLNHIGEIISNREKVWSKYHQELTHLITFPEINPSTRWNFSYVPVVLESEKQLLTVVDALEKENIYPRRYFYPSLDTLTYLKVQRSCENSRNISRRVLCLPTFNEMKIELVDHICEMIKKAVQK